MSDHILRLLVGVVVGFLLVMFLQRDGRKR